jgi:ADP-ribose pyrophosphatase YjhB (NUDIX family)
MISGAYGTSKDSEASGITEMGFKPQDFFIGLIHFFSILMLGALLSYLGKDMVAKWTGRVHSFPLDKLEDDLIFLFSAYILWHFIFLVRAGLDVIFYDRIRAWTDLGQIKRLSEGKGLRWKWKRAMIRPNFLFGKNADTAVMRAKIGKTESLMPLPAEKSINAFQWSKARFTKEHPEGLATVVRFEADSKFFRSFVILLIPMLAVLSKLAYHDAGKKPLLLIVSFILILALRRYVELRFKSTQYAYWNILTLDAAKKRSPAGPVAPGNPRQAGGVVYRIHDGKAEFLLVEGNGRKNDWVLPKGNIEPGEGSRETAVREAREESGHWARVEKWIDDFDLRTGHGTKRVRFFLMRMEEEGRLELPQVRAATWFNSISLRRMACIPNPLRSLRRLMLC